MARRVRTPKSNIPKRSNVRARTGFIYVQRGHSEAQPFVTQDGIAFITQDGQMFITRG